MSAAAAWRLLDISATDDVRIIRRAYAAALRALDPDADPEAFDRLRAARAIALDLAAEQVGETSDDTPVGILDDEVPATAPPIDVPATGGEHDRIVPLPPHRFDPPLVRGVAVGTLAGAPPSPLDPLRINPIPPTEGARHDIRVPAFPFPSAPTLSLGVVTGAIGPLDRDPTARVEAAYGVFINTLLPGGQPSHLAVEGLEAVRLDLAIETILADPRIEELEYYSRVENWLAGVLADAIPRSDAVLVRLADRFRWRERAAQIGETPAIDRVVERLDTLDFVAKISQPGHRQHRAWKELTRPATESSRRGMFVRKDNVNALLKDIRQHHPEAEAWLDTYRVGKWESDGGTVIPWWAMLAAFFFVVKACLSTVGDRPAPAPSPYYNVADVLGPGDPTPPRQGTQAPPEIAGLAAGQSQLLTTADANLTSLLLTLVPGMTAETLKASNPKLYRVFVDRWTALHQRGGRVADFDKALQTYLDERVDRAASVAGADVIADMTRNAVARYRAVESRYGATVCGQWLIGRANVVPTIPQDLWMADRALRYRAILAAKPGAGTPAPSSWSFSVPEDLVEDVMARTKWSRERYELAIMDKGPPADSCTVSIALNEAALALPRREGTEVMRDILGG